MKPQKDRIGDFRKVSFSTFVFFFEGNHSGFYTFLEVEINIIYEKSVK